MNPDEIDQRNVMRSRGLRGEIMAMAAALLGASAVMGDRESKQESIGQVFDEDEARRRYLTGQPQYNAEQQKAADAIRAERERRKAENWAKRQPKGKA